MGVGLGQQPFDGCKINNCISTSNKSLLKESAAVIFHVGDYRINDPLPAIRFAHQRYIFYLFESNANTVRNLPFFTNTNSFFNWKMTHRRDSDLYSNYFYGALKRKDNCVIPDYLPAILPPGVEPKLPENLFEKKSDHRIIAKKTQLIVWFC